jgi:radical SAM protein with 4Fe4S-binding SPASM domain
MNLQLSGNKLLYHIDILRKWQNGEDFYPLNLEIGPTSVCNMRCVHCYVQHLGHKPVSLADEVFLNLMKDCVGARIKAVVICGTGEPLLHKKTPEAITIAAEGGVDVGMMTNGVLLTPQIADKILPKIAWVRFSILGINKETYIKLHQSNGRTWAKLYSNLEEIARLKKEKNLKVTLGVSCALMPENGPEIHLMAKKFKELGFDYFVVRPVGQDEVHGIIFDRDLSKRFEKELKLAEACAVNNVFNVTVRKELFDFEEKRRKREYKKCLGLPFIACIDASGYIYACNGRWGDKNYIYGNINQKSFLDIWNSPEHKKKIRELMETVNTEECPIMCRQNSINEFLWNLKNPPDHINFL